MDPDPAAPGPSAPDPGVPEPSTTSARIQGMLLSRFDAATAVDEPAQTARAVTGPDLRARASPFIHTDRMRSSGATDALQPEPGDAPCLTAWATAVVVRVDAPRRLGASSRAALADRQEAGAAVGVLMERQGIVLQQARAALLNETLLQNGPLAQAAHRILARPSGRED